VAFGFFAFSGVETAVAKGTDCWLVFCFDERTWGVGAGDSFWPCFIKNNKFKKMWHTNSNNTLFVPVYPAQSGVSLCPLSGQVVGLVAGTECDQST
jgi:hypothetical protein